MSFETCDQFFGITELLELFLQQCSPHVLLNCTMVCRTWSQIIHESPLLQEHLFLQPTTAREGVKVTLNPMLAYFAPILVAKSASEEISCKENHVRREDLTSLPWARGTSMDAPSRRAFAHRYASWRNMLVSQPPISRLDWWHEWTHKCAFTKDEDLGYDNHHARGWGHQYSYEYPITLGLLWDIVEGRLARGCSALVQFFPDGMNVDDDAHAHEQERQLIADNDPRRRPYLPDQSRIVLRTNHAMSEDSLEGTQCILSLPKLKESMDEHEQGCPATSEDGFNMLRKDCQTDLRMGPRWAKSEGFWCMNVTGESSS
jgi:hypothetical protein